MSQPYFAKSSIELTGQHEGGSQGSCSSFSSLTSGSSLGESSSNAQQSSIELVNETSENA